MPYADTREQWQLDNYENLSKQELKEIKETNKQQTVELIKDLYCLIKEHGSFPFIYFSEAFSLFESEVVDFAIASNFANKYAQWQQLCQDKSCKILDLDLYSSIDSFYDKHGKRNAKIVFLVKNFRKAKDPIHVDKLKAFAMIRKPLTLHSRLVPFC